MLEAKGREWRPIFPGSDDYWVSNDGRVCSLRSGNATLLAQRPGTQSPYYMYVTLKDERVGRRPYFVHQLVLFAFGAPRPSKKHETRHLDGNAKNNHHTNLEWGTSKQNAADRDKHGTAPKGTRHWRARLNNGEVRVIRKLGHMGVKRKRIAAIFDISLSTVYRIRSGQRWAHVGA